MGKLIIAIVAGIITALLFVVLLRWSNVDYPGWLPYLVGYISMEADLIKFDNLMGELYSKVFK